MSYWDYLETKNYSYVYSGAKDKWIWTTTPITNSGGYINNYILNYNGSTVTTSTTRVNNGYGYNAYNGETLYIYSRPVVVFKKSIIVKGGNGTKDNPYTIGY